MTSTNPLRRAWFKSSYSDSSNNCVEVAFDGDVVLVRDSKYTGPADLQPTIAVPVTHWGVFLNLVLSDNGQSDDIAIPSVVADSRGTVVRDAVGSALEFTAAEWRAFIAGVQEGEFAPVSV